MYEINIGDFVAVDFNGSQFTLCLRGKVLYVPKQPGESWIIYDDNKHSLYYVSEPCTITKVITPE